MRFPRRVWVVGFYLALAAATVSFLAPTVPAVGEGIAHADKGVHFVIFAALALLALRAHPEKPRWGVFAALVFYGACIELAQARVGRTMDALDLLADAAGAFVAFTPWGARSAPQERDGDV